MKEDRDFHNEQHITLRNEILGIVKQEYELDSIKREKTFIEEELRSYKEKTLIYEKQIDELTILAKRPVSQSANGGNPQEHYYAKKIMELETQIKEISTAKDKLTFENNALKKGLKDGNIDSNAILDQSIIDTDAVASQLQSIKRKNESLKKENEIIRRELESFKEKGFIGGGPSKYSN